MTLHFLAAHVRLVYELGGVFLGFGIIIVIAAFLMAYFDELSFEDAIYFSLITALTVGFGDLSPRSRGARIVSVVLSAMGVLFMGIMVGIVVHSLHVAIEATGWPE